MLECDRAVSQSFPSRHRRSFLRATALMTIVVLMGCSGSSGGPGLPLEWRSIDFGGVQNPLIDRVYRNSEIRIEFSDPIDPDSVTDDTFGVYGGDDFDERVPGEVRLVDGGATLVFVPDLADTLRGDGDAGGWEENRRYRVVVPGTDTQLDTIRTSWRGRRTLEEGLRIEFRARAVPPVYYESRPDAPVVAGFLIDLDGDGILGSDPRDFTFSDEFFQLPNDSEVPIATGVRVGSQSLPIPNGPLTVGIVYDRAMDATSLLDRERHESLAASLAVMDRSYPCDDPNPGDSCRPRLPIREAVDHVVLEDASVRTILVLRVLVSLDGLSTHIVKASNQVTDLVGRPLATTAEANFITSDGLDADVVIEPFAHRNDRDRETTAAWSTTDTESLFGTIGFGGDGLDGPLHVSSLGTRVLDTSAGTGEWNFSSIRADHMSTITIVGDKPAILRVSGDVVLSYANVEADGESGQRGRDDVGEPLLGGRGGPGGGDGGTAFPTVSGGSRGGDGHTPPDVNSMVGGEGGGYGLRPGGGGGGGCRSPGDDGLPGEGEANGGRGGDALDDNPGGYWTGTTGPGGSGGGAGGNFVDGIANRLGGSGGGGGGAILFDVGGTFNQIEGYISASGGHGGPGAGNQIGSPSGGGGGGSAGSVRIRARDAFFDTITTNPGSPDRAIDPAGKGGRGGRGLERVEYFHSYLDRGFSNPRVVQMQLGNPLGFSIGRSCFYPTNHRQGQTQWTFDGSDPSTGAILLGNDIEDISVIGADGSALTSLPRGITMSIHFSGALEDPRHPPFADPSTVTHWVTDIRELDGYPMIRFEVRIRGDEIVVADEDFEYPGVDDIRLRFRRP